MLLGREGWGCHPQPLPTPTTPASTLQIWLSNPITPPATPWPKSSRNTCPLTCFQVMMKMERPPLSAGSSNSPQLSPRFLNPILPHTMTPWLITLNPFTQSPKIHGIGPQWRARPCKLWAAARVLSPPTSPTATASTHPPTHSETALTVRVPTKARRICVGIPLNPTYIKLAIHSSSLPP